MTNEELENSKARVSKLNGGPLEKLEKLKMDGSRLPPENERTDSDNDWNGLQSHFSHCLQ